MPCLRFPSLPSSSQSQLQASSHRPRPAGENPSHLWPPGSSSAYKSVSAFMSTDGSRPPHFTCRSFSSCRCRRRRGPRGIDHHHHGEDSVLRQQGHQEGAMGAGGGQVARRLRPGQRTRQLAHAPQARGYVRTYVLCSSVEPGPAAWCCMRDLVVRLVLVIS